MTTPHTHHDRAAEAAGYADQLQADLVSLSGMLDQYHDRSEGSGIENLRERSFAVRRQLEAIAQRLDGLGGSADPGKYPLSDQEHAALDGARNLRERMKDALESLQRAERRPGQTWRS
jgi:hypothetical protein